MDQVQKFQMDAATKIAASEFVASIIEINQKVWSELNVYF